jgi:phage shock protein A
MQMELTLLLVTFVLVIVSFNVSSTSETNLKVQIESLTEQIRSIDRSQSQAHTGLIALQAQMQNLEQRTANSVEQLKTLISDHQTAIATDIKQSQEHLRRSEKSLQSLQTVVERRFSRELKTLVHNQDELQNQIAVARAELANASVGACTTEEKVIEIVEPQREAA